MAEQAEVFVEFLETMTFLSGSFTWDSNEVDLVVGGGGGMKDSLRTLTAMTNNCTQVVAKEGDGVPLSIFFTQTWHQFSCD